MALATPPLDRTPPLTARPPWPRAASTESLPHNIPPGAPALTNRRSAYSLSSAQDRKPSDFRPHPPQRPLRHPSRPGPANRSPTAGDANHPRSHDEQPTSSEFLVTPVSPVSVLAPTRLRSSLSTGPVEVVTPWDLYPALQMPGRLTMATGRVEEVTPWELQPVPDTVPQRSTLATGPAEEVTPWELYPSPASPNLPGSSPTSPTPRLSSSLGHSGKSLSDHITHIRRRKSTSARVAKTRLSTSTRSSQTFHDGALSTSLQPTAGRASTSKITSIQPSKSAPSAPRVGDISSTPEIPSSLVNAPLPVSLDAPPKATHRFSTVDRTILQELRRNIEVRASQFVLKGAESSTGSGLGRKGKKHHTFAQEEVPYPRNFEREVLDLDVWETALLQDTCESPTWHVFDTLPTKVLDVGCGTGIWVLNAARTWKDAKFVGLDIVPLQPDLQYVGSSDLSSRITWVHANFLDGLPFPNEEFDFVHIKRIALGVPEDKWNFLFEEITRVMKPGAAFEMFEEDLFFPGKLIDDECDSEGDGDGSELSHLQLPDMELANPPASGAQIIAVPVLVENSLASSVTRSDSSTHNEAAKLGEQAEDEAQDLLAQVMVDYDSHQQDDDSALAPLSDVQPHFPVSTQEGEPNKSSTSLGSAFGSPAPMGSRKRGYSLTGSDHLYSSDRLFRLRKNSQASEAPSLPLSPRHSPVLLRTIPKPPMNPRDHSVLAIIYNQMLGSRFINLSPLALLANSLGMYFTDVRTHPPVQHAFPPVVQKSIPETGVSPDGDVYDSDDARNAILPSSATRSQQKDSESTSILTEDSGASEVDRYVNLGNLLQHTSRYITLDESRITAFSPSPKTSLVSSGRKIRVNRLPNTTTHIDLKALNLHLALRTTEILACSEAMWEWVKEFQDFNRPKISLARSGSVDAFTSRRPATSVLDMQEKAIVQMTREEFDNMLSRFEMDMQDQFSHGRALNERFFWSVGDLPVSTERKNFEMACEKWDKWELEHSAMPPYQDSPSIQTLPELSGPGRRRTEGRYRREKAAASGRESPARRLSRALRVFVAWKAS